MVVQEREGRKGGSHRGVGKAAWGGERLFIPSRGFGLADWRATTQSCDEAGGEGVVTGPLNRMA